MNHSIIVDVALRLQDVTVIQDNVQVFLFFKFNYFAIYADKMFISSPQQLDTTNQNEEILSKIDVIRTTNASREWFPSIFIVNDRSERIYSTPPDEESATPGNGTKILQKKMDVLLECLSDFKFYPFDVIECKIQLFVDEESSTNQTTLKWLDTKPFQLSAEFTSPILLSLEKLHYVSKQPSSTNLVMSLYFTRKYHFYLWKFYLPVLITLLFSWIPLWLKRVLVLRIYIGMSTVIFLGWYYISKPNELQLPYLTALETWRSINFVFVVLAALESILVAYMIKSNSPKMKRMHPDENEKFKMLRYDNCPIKKRYLEVSEDKTDLELEILKLKANFKLRFVNVAKEIEIIDSVAKLFFPSAYCIFLVFYCFKCYNNLTSIEEYSEL